MFGSLGDSKASKTLVAGLKKSQQQSMRRLTVQRGGGYAALALGQLDRRWVPGYHIVQYTCFGSRGTFAVSQNQPDRSVLMLMTSDRLFHCISKLGTRSPSRNH